MIYPQHTPTFEHVFHKENVKSVDKSLDSINDERYIGGRKSTNG